MAENVQTQSSGSRNTVLIVGLIVLTALVVFIVAGATMVWAVRNTALNVAESAGGLAEVAEGVAAQAEAVAEGVSERAEKISEAAEGVADAASLGSASGQIFDPTSFVKVQDEYVLRQEDLTESYYVPRGEERRWANSGVILDIGEYEGKTYILETGRVDGWAIRLKRSNRTVIAPGVYESSVQVFETSEGAMLAISPEWFPAYSDEEKEFKFVKNGCDLGDHCILYSYEEFNPATGLTTMRYDAAFVYNNVLVVVSARGLDLETKQEDALNAAEILYGRLLAYQEASE